MVAAGTLNEIIDIETNTGGLDGMGGQLEVWVKTLTRERAAVSALSGDERFTGDQVVSQEQYRFRVRYHAGTVNLTTRNRLIYPAGAGTPPLDSVFDILAILPFGHNEGFDILAARRGDK